MENQNDSFINTKEFYNLNFKSEILVRIDEYLSKKNDKVLNFDSDIITDPKMSKKTIEKLKSELSKDLENIENHIEKPSKIDSFINSFNSSKISLKLKKKLSKQKLTQSNLFSLRMNPTEFYGLKPNSSGDIVSNPFFITEGAYCNTYLAEKIVKEVEKYLASIKMPFWSIFSYILRKDHKYLSFLFGLTIEHTKKSLISLSFLYWNLQILACHIAIRYFD